MKNHPQVGDMWDIPYQKVMIRVVLISGDYNRDFFIGDRLDTGKMVYIPKDTIYHKGKFIRR